MQIDNNFIQQYEPMLRRMAQQYSKHLKKCPALEEDDLVQEAWLALMERENLHKRDTSLRDDPTLHKRDSSLRTLSTSSILCVNFPSLGRSSILCEKMETAPSASLDMEARSGGGKEVRELTPMDAKGETDEPEILSVASNAMQDAIRRYGGLMEPLERVAQTLAAEEEEADPLDDEIVRMEQCLARLSPREQHVLRRLYGLDHQPVASRDRLAQEMGLTLINLDVIHHRSLERLRQMMK